MKLNIGTRGSDLALWQARHVAQRLTEAGAEVDITVLVTRGDRIDDVPLHLIDGKAFFTKEIEDALLSEQIDVAVHSHKDLPVEGPVGLTIAAVPARAGAGERLLVRREAYDPAGHFLPLRQGARVGTSAPRRQAQVTALRGDLVIEHLRGNVPTRVQRLRDGGYDAIVLAAAGLDRLQLETSDLVCVNLGTRHFVPAPGQGALGVQVRTTDAETLSFVRAAMHDAASAANIEAERGLLLAAGGGCNLALGAHVQALSNGKWEAHVFRGPDGSDSKRPARWAQVVADTADEAARKGLELASQSETTGMGPLAEMRVALTGTRNGGGRLRERLGALGAEVLSEAVIECAPIEGTQLGERLARLDTGDGMVFTSRQAVNAMQGLTIPTGVLVAAVGSGTAQALENMGITADVVGTGGARDLAEALPMSSVKHVLHPCAAEALPDLRDALELRGIQVESLPVYITRAMDSIELRTGVDARVYLSPSAVRAAAQAEAAGQGGQAARVALGAHTGKALDEAQLHCFTPPDGDRESIIGFLLNHTPTLEPTS